MVIGACGALVSVPLIGASVTAATALLSAGCPPIWWSVTGWVLLAAVPGWLLLLGASGAAVLSPAARKLR